MINIKTLTPRRALLTAATLGLASLGLGQPAPTVTAVPGAASLPSANVPAPSKPSASTPAANSPGQLLPAPDRSTPVGATIAGGLASSSTVSAIQRQEFDKRDELLSEVANRVQQADRQVAELKQRGASLEGDGKQSLDVAAAAYEKAKAKLQQSLEASRSADSNTWERTRVTLATDYAFYVAAAAGVEVAAPNT